MKTKHQHIILSAPVTQNGDQTLNNPIRPRWFALALSGFLFISVLALSPSPGEAQCQQWDVSGQWEIRQSNGISVALHVTQNGSKFSVFAEQHNGGSTSGNRGNVVDNDFYLVIEFPGGHTGLYRGTIDKNGYIRGTTYDKSNTLSTATWHGNHYFKCADAAAAPAPPAPPKVIKSSGKAKPATNETGVYSQGLPANPNVNGTAGGFIQMHTPAPTPSPEAAESASAEADESSSNDTDDQHGKHKKNKNKKKHHHHHDDDQN